MVADEGAAQLAERIAAAFAVLPQVTAVALAGSRVGGFADAASDIDLYVYAAPDIPLDDRRRIAQSGASYAEVDNRFWGPEDAWVDRETGIKVEAMYRSPAWIEEQLERSLAHFQASTGYSTCFWFNVLHSERLYDRDGWYARLQTRAQTPYPEALRRAIIANNYPILRERSSAYARQIESALRRDDLVSVNHRTAALLASYFDIVFAVNRLPHPGEKRLMAYAEARCPLRPAALREDVTRLLRAAADGAELLAAIDNLVDGLDAILLAEGLLPVQT